MSWSWLQVTYVWKRGSPHPRPVPNGYLMDCLPHEFWQVWDEIKDGRKISEIKKNWMMIEELMSFMFMTQRRMRRGVEM